jgi:hypothetical protein
VLHHWHRFRMARSLDFGQGETPVAAVAMEMSGVDEVVLRP